MAEVGVELRYQAGWLTLSLQTEDSQLSVRGTTLAPIAADLVAGLQDIADGRRSVSVRWEGEPGGVFLDFAQGETGWNSGRCSLAVHRVDQEALDRLGDDSPVRGPLLFSATTSTAALLTGFVESIASVRPDLDAVTRRPRRPFPDASFATLLLSTAAHRDQSDGRGADRRGRINAVWAKPELEFHRPAEVWVESAGSLGVSDLLLSRDPASGDSTLLQRYAPGGATGRAVITHEYWEEVLVMSGELTDDARGITAKAGMYACRPPGMRHGPYTSTPGCLLLVTTRMP